MNEQIKEFIKQAGTDTSGKWMGVEHAEKFAELIVKECAKIAYKTSWDDLVHGHGQAVIPLHLYNTIREHFGVEE